MKKLRLLSILFAVVLMIGCSGAKFDGTYELTGFIVDGRSEVVPVGDNGNAGSSIEIKGDKFTIHIAHTDNSRQKVVDDWDGTLTDIEIEGEPKDSNIRTVSLIQNGANMGIGTLNAQKKEFIFTLGGTGSTHWLMQKK